MLLLFGAFIAGILTVLAPCVLPLLPIIIGGSVSGDQSDKKRPVIIAISLGLSMLIFTVLLKATTLLIDVSPRVITGVSGAIIIVLGILTLFPTIYANAIAKLGVESKALGLLSKGGKSSNKYVGAIITGAALGPVFSSCSPVYGYILATVLPVNFSLAMVYMISYVLGLVSVLLLIGYFGQRFIKKIGWLANPKGLFQKIIGILFITVGLLVFTGLDKKFQTFVSQNTPFNFDGLSARLIPASDRKTNNELYNVESPYQAPEIVGVKDWINSEPITLEGLKGKVVLVDFWTYSCINCIRNNPYLIKWHEQYKDKGFEIVGLHAPEFAFERVKANVEKAVKDQNIPYPVGLDNDFATWGAFQNQYWPTLYLIDGEGNVRRIHSGEGEYAETEEAIRGLIEENGQNLGNVDMTVGSDAMPPITEGQTPETYLGLKRSSNYSGAKALGNKSTEPFVFINDLKQDYWTLDGMWNVGDETIDATGNSKLRFKIAAKEVYIVASSDNAGKIRILLNGKPISETMFAGDDVVDSIVTITESKLYKLVKYDMFTEGDQIELQTDNGIKLNVFTFGS